MVSWAKTWEGTSSGTDKGRDDSCGGDTAVSICLSASTVAAAAAPTDPAALCASTAGLVVFVTAVFLVVAKGETA